MTSEESGVPAPAPRSPRLGGTRQALSARELEVLGLVVAGRSNGEIGRALFISKKTASVHVANIKAKFGAETRIEIVTIALAMGLVEPLLDATPAIGAPNLGAGTGSPDASRIAGQLEAPRQGSVIRPGAGPAHGRTFVGREAELQVLERAFEAASGGRAGLVMVVGEPGIGKSRIAAELATHSRLRRAQVLWGRCYESAGAPPYWPFVQALRAYVRDHDEEQLRRQLGGGAAALAEIVPEITDKLPGLAPLPAAEPPQARFRLFDSVTAFLRAASAEQPILFVVDDLHWADAGTLALLEFLARDLEGSRLLVVGTYRELELTKGHPLAATLAELTRELVYERVTLKGLGAEDVGRFIVGTAAISPPPALVEAVYRHTEGNPLFVTEVVRLLMSEGALSPERLVAREQLWSVRIPDGVREVIGRRLERLTERSQETLRTAALVGREFSLDQLAALSPEFGEELLLAVLEEALGARLVEELPRSVGRFAFTHALVQDTLAAGLSATRRARLHARIGATLERLYGERADEHAAELAYHFGEAGAAESERFVRYALVAGAQALASYAIDQAQELFSRIVEIRTGSPLDADLAAAMLGVGQAMSWSKEPEDYVRALPYLSAAFDWYVAAADLERAVATATCLPPDAFALPPEVRVMIRRSLALVPPASLLSARLLAFEGWFDGLEDHDYEAATDALGQAVAIARDRGDRPLEARALAFWAHVDQFHLRYQLCVEHSASALQLAIALRDDQLEMLAQVLPVRALCALGQPRQALLHAEAGTVIGERMRDPYGMSTGPSQGAFVSLMEGDWEAARRSLARCPAGVERYLYVTVNRLYLEYQLGSVEAGERYIQRTEENLGLMWYDPRDTAVLAFAPVFGDWLAGTDGRIDRARERAELMLTASKRVPWTDCWANAGLGLSAVIRGEPELAERAYDQLVGLGPCAAELPLLIEHLNGLFAQTMGRTEAAVGHYEAALSFARKAGYRPPYGWAAADYAALLLQRGGDRDHARAIELQNEALAIGRELGMRPLVERVLSRREILTA